LPLQAAVMRLQSGQLLQPLQSLRQFLQVELVQSDLVRTSCAATLPARPAAWVTIQLGIYEFEFCLGWAYGS